MAPRRNSRAGLAVATVTAPVRCAIYTRKSTDEGLDRDFNSLDNQREAAEAFIASQRHEGWSALPDRYDDGGFSGGNVERPALKRLLADVEADQIDTIAVYKLDRLSRSLVDFGRVHEFLDKHRVALVSVTESINTTSPHGRMMVNVLLSFAQYERELIGERTRDKLRAARRHGKWTGGHPPLGYDVVDRRLALNKMEADQVRAIFDLYVETPSVVKVAAELNRRGWTKKSWTARGGNRRGGGTWNRVNLARLLKDPLYTGKQKLGDEVFAGEHPRIVPQALFDRVQKMIRNNRRSRGAGGRNRHGALLRDLLHCTACGRAMTHAPARAHGRLYRYYRCQGAQKNGAESCPTKPLKAETIETFVVDQIRRIGADRDLQDEVFKQAVGQVKAHRRGLKLEAKRLVDELTRTRAEIERLVATLSRLDGSAADAVAAELGKAQELMQTLDARQAEVKAEVDSLKVQDIDREAVTRALVEFNELWSVLLTPERERILGLLIERVDYHGGDGQLGIKWRLSGFGELAAEVAP